MRAQAAAAVLAALLAAAAGGDPARGQPAEATGRPAAGDAAANQVLAQLGSDAIAAQQVGILAADKNMQAAYALLGDQMALVNNQVNRALEQVANENRLSVVRVMDGQARQRFERMKTLNKDQFAQELVAFVNDTYPRILTGIDSLSRQMPDSQAVATLANESGPRLRDQMRAAQQLARGESAQQSAETPDRGPIQRKDDPAVIPDTTAPQGAAPQDR